jgi:hypothetical protein
MTKNDIANMLALIAQVFPHFEQGEQAINVWYWLFKHERKVLLKQALKQALLKSQFPPTPALVKECLDDLCRYMPDILHYSAETIYNDLGLLNKGLAKSLLDSCSQETSSEKKFQLFKEKLEKAQNEILEKSFSTGQSFTESTKQILTKHNLTFDKKGITYDKLN